MPTPVRADKVANLQARHVGGWRLALICALAVLALALAPVLLNSYWMRVLAAVFTMAVIAQGINLMAGYTGYPAFGNIVFYGVGAYSTAILMGKAGWSFPMAATAATLTSTLLALSLGPWLLRLKGHYFAIATLGLNEAFREVVTNASALTGGGMGLSLPLPSGGALQNSQRFYLMLLVLMLIATWITWEFNRRSIGLGCQAIRDNELKAEAIGLDTMRYKTAAWMISAAMTGAAGAIQAWWLTYIDPPSMFNMGMAVKAFVILLLGGAGTVFGPLFGAFAVELLANLTWSRLLDWHLGAMGLIVMGVVLLFPNGFMAALGASGWIGHLLGKWRRAIGKVGRQ